MAKKKVSDLIAIKITGPDCRLGDKYYQPGETATVPVDIAAEWIQSERATAVVAEINGKEER